MLGTHENLRIRFLIRALIPFAALALCVPWTASYLRGVPDRTGAIVALCSVAIGVAWWIIVGRIRFGIDDTGVRRSGAFGEHALRWEEIVEYRYAAPRPVHVDGAIAAAAAASLNGGVLTLRAADGRRLALGPGFSGAHTAIERIAGQLDAVRRKQLASALHDGDPVTFGSITVQRDGLVCGDEELVAWSDLTSVQVLAGSLLVRRGGRKRPYFKVRTRALPHFFLLLQLLVDHGVRVIRE